MSRISRLSPLAGEMAKPKGAFPTSFPRGLPRTPIRGRESREVPGAAAVAAILDALPAPPPLDSRLRENDGDEGDESGFASEMIAETSEKDGRRG